MGSDEVGRAREAFAAGDWRRARALLERVRDGAAADGHSAAGDLAAPDLELLARATWWLGDTAASREVAEDAYRARAAAGESEAAASVALELALSWALEGDVVIGQAWLNRAHRVLRDLEEGPTHGYLRYLEGSFALELSGDQDSAARSASEVLALAERFDDDALRAMALALSGLAALWGGRTEVGFGDLDEAMLVVLSGAVPPLWAGDVHCTVIHLCHELGDLARMRAWTDTMNRWAAPLSSTFLYAAVTRVHQLQLLSAEGEWDEVEREVSGLSRALVGSHGWVAGEGYRELGDIRRLSGDRDGARAAYERARDLSVSAEPGAALLAEAEGRPAEALALLRAALGESGHIGRARLLLPTVEVALRAGDVPLAESAATELAETARRHDTPGLRAWADHAAAELLLHRGAWQEALAPLETAAAVYRAQRSRYATARVHELVARAHDGLGHRALAEAERATATAIYDRLGAAPDVARLAPHRPPGGLTEREVEVLRRVARGASNRDVARELVISEKTVSRHLANVYAKAGVSSRTAAAAWAREHGIDAAPLAPAPNTP
ncbi:LuxR C-terminal-related transcriptional regulator [Oryzobacter sp. R7]|uniref:LuxR C-terminal-related transcriptional regulator n=1 Tax=Oryzobacter faecalis TaxID=3388656 RepID=UPI00398CDFBF